MLKEGVEKVPQEGLVIGVDMEHVEKYKGKGVFKT